MERIKNKIKGKIISSNLRYHRNYKDSLQKNPIAKIERPHSFFYDWESKMSIQAALNHWVSTYAELLNFILVRTSMFLSVNSIVEDRLKREFCKIKKTYTSLIGEKKTAYKKLGSHHLLLFEKEVCFYSQHIQIPGRLATQISLYIHSTIIIFYLQGGHFLKYDQVHNKES